MNIPAFDPPDDLGFAAPFWDAIAEAELRLPRCSVCQSWQWYPSDAGTCCDAGALEWVKVPGVGTVYTFTRVRRSFLPQTQSQAQRDAPFLVAFVQLDNVDGVRLVANVSDDDIAIGDRVCVHFVQVNGRSHPVFSRA